MASLFIPDLIAEVQSFLSLHQWPRSACVSRTWHKASRLQSAASHGVMKGLSFSLSKFAQKTARSVRISVSQGELFGSTQPPSFLCTRLQRFVLTELPTLELDADVRTAWLVWISQIVESAPLESLQLPTALFDAEVSADPPSFAFLAWATRLKDLSVSGEFVSSALVSAIPLLPALESLRLPACIMDSTMAAAFEARVEMGFPRTLEPNEAEANRDHARQLLAHIANHSTLSRLELMASYLGVPSSIDLELLLADDAPVFPRITHLVMQHTSVDPAVVDRLKHLGTHFPSLTSFNFQQEFDWPADEPEWTDEAAFTRYNKLLTLLSKGIKPLEGKLTSLGLFELSHTRAGQHHLQEVGEEVESYVLRRMSCRDLAPLLFSATCRHLRQLDLATRCTTQDFWSTFLEEDVMRTMARRMPHLRSAHLRQVTKERLGMALRRSELEELYLHVEFASWVADESEPILRRPIQAPKVTYIARVIINGTNDETIRHVLNHLPSIGTLSFEDCTISLTSLLRYAQFVPLAFRHRSEVADDSVPDPQGNPTASLLFDAQPVSEDYFRALPNLGGGIISGLTERMDSRIGGAHLFGRCYSLAVVSASTASTRRRMAQAALVRWYNCRVVQGSHEIDLRPYLAVHEATLYLRPVIDAPQPMRRDVREWLGRPYAELDNQEYVSTRGRD